MESYANKSLLDSSELLSVPSDLRVCLETCLSDVPSEATLEKHLPQVRGIIIGLLTGLRQKQKLYREGAALRRGREIQERANKEQAELNARANSNSNSNSNLTRSNSSSTRTSLNNSTGGNNSNSTESNSQLTPASASRSRDQLRKFVTSTQASSGSTQSLPVTRSSTPSFQSTYVPPPSSPPPPPPQQLPLPPSMSTLVRPQSPPRIRIAPDPPTSTPIARNPSINHSPTLTPKPVMRRTASAVTEENNSAKVPISRSSTSLRDSVRSSRSTDADSFVSLPSGASNSSLAGALGNFSPHRSNSINKGRRSSPPPPPRDETDRGPVPTTPTDYQSSIANFPNPLPEIARSPSMKFGFDDPFSPTLDSSTQDAAQLRSLENLKSSDTLSRRASKRFSAYNIQKITTGTSPARNGDSITGSSSGGIMGGTSSSRMTHKSRVSDVGIENGTSAGRELSGLEEKRVHGTKKVSSRPSNSEGGRIIPPLPTSTSYEGGLRDPSAIIKEEEVESPPRWSTTPSITRSESTINLGSPARSFTSSLPTEIPSPSPTISVPLSESVNSPNTNIITASTNNTTSRSTRQQPSEDSEIEPEFPISVYLQIGRDVKKVKLDLIPTVALLRVQFIERFQYNPGQADFPDIYLRDPVIGVQYELEDMNEVKNGSVLSLNIDRKRICTSND